MSTPQRSRRASVGVILAGLGLAGPLAADEYPHTIWCEDFDGYEAGAGMFVVGQDCGILGCADDTPADCVENDFNWEGFNLDPDAARSVVSTAFSRNGKNSVEVKSVTTDNLVHTFNQLAIGPTGAYRISTDIFVPLPATGRALIILLNTYMHQGPKNTSARLIIDADASEVRAEPDGETLPLTRGSWVSLEVTVDLDNDRQTVRYGGALLYEDSWTDRIGKAGQLSIEAFNCRSVTATPIFLDNMRMFELLLAFDEPEEFAAAGAAKIHAIGNIDTANTPGPDEGTADVAVLVPGEDPEAPGLMEVFLNQGTTESGAWLGLVPNDVVLTGLDPSGVALGLFNDDDFIDAAVSNAGDGTVFVYLGDASGNGTFLSPVILPVGSNPQAITAGDFDEDSDIDLAVTTETQVLLFANDGSGTFDIPAFLEISGPSGMNHILPDDLDNDKDLDLLVTRSLDGEVAVYFLEAGNLVSTELLELGQLLPVDLATGNFDGNAYPDIATANNGDATVSVILNDLGTFGPPITLNVGMLPRSVDAADLDGTLYDDLVVAADDAMIGPAVQVLVNRTDAGAVRFSAPFPFGVDADPNFVSAVDLDLDGRQDIVTSNTDDGMNPGPFGSVTALLATNPAATCVGDVDGDGSTGFPDLLEILGEWGPYAPCPPHKPTDLDADCDVGFADLLIVLGAWGPC